MSSPLGGGWEHRPFEEPLERLDEARVVHLVDLDGGSVPTQLDGGRNVGVAWLRSGF